MTLVVGAINARFAIQVSDRRVTWSAEKSPDDESNKLFLFNSDACRFVVGYTGLAHDGRGFAMKEWLATALRDAGPPEYEPQAIVERLRKSLSTVFSSRLFDHLVRSMRRTTVMLTGYVLTDQGSLPTYCLLTNFQDFNRGSDDALPWDEFKVWWISAMPTTSYCSVQRIGAWEKLPIDSVNQIKAILSGSAPASAVVGKICSLIRAVAGLPGLPSTVGRQLMSAVINSDFGEAAKFEYHTDHESHAAYVPTAIFSGRAVGQSIIRDVKIEAISPNAGPLIYPKQRGKSPCKCGSGKKYKRCHGETQR